MIKPDCIPVDPNPQKQKEEEVFMKTAREFQNLPIMQILGNSNRVAMFRRILNHSRDAVHGFNTKRYHEVPNAEELKVFKRIRDRELKNITRKRGFFAKWLYLPKEIYKDIPFVEKWYQDVQNSNYQQKGFGQYFDSQIASVMRNLKEASARYGYDFKSAQADIRKLYATYNKQRQKGLHEEAINTYAEIDKFIQKGEGRALREFHELVTMKSNDFDSSLGKYDANIYEAATIYRRNIQPVAQQRIMQGIRNFRNGIRKSMSQFRDIEGAKDLTNKENTGILDNIIKKYESKQLQKDGYFPVLTFDIMPTLSRASELLYSSKGDTRQEAIDMIKSVDKIFSDNAYINEHLGNTNKQINGPINYNVIPIIDSYVRSANRFNYTSFNVLKYSELLKNINDVALKAQNDKGMYELDAKLKFLENYASDHYDVISGGFKDAGGANLARTLTSYQFLSKLGLNFRAAARNATQSLFNYIWFGSKGILDTNRMLNNKEMQTRVQQGLENNGILFPEFQEIYGALPYNRYFDKKSGTIKLQIDNSLGQSLQNRLEEVARISGKPMEFVENNINRRFTYKIGYTSQWKLMSADPNFVSNFDRHLERKIKKAKGKDKERLMVASNAKLSVERLKGDRNKTETIFKEKDATVYEVELEMYKRRLADNAGNAAVENLHFDYSLTGKNKFLTTPTGAVIGQFQHYGVNFFNLQRKIALGAKDAIFAGQWNSAAGWRMYRLGIMYATINGLISPILNANFGNLVQNDTWERFKNYRDAFQSDDPERRKDAFFGKGPIIGTAGGPTISDLITIGNLSGLYELEEDDMLSYLVGYQDESEKDGNEKFQEVIRLLNTQVHRAYTNTFPRMSKGVNLGVLVQGELGLFPTKDTRAQKERLRNLYKGADRLVGDYLPDLPEKKKKSTSKPKQNINEILRSLNNL